MPLSSDVFGTFWHFAFGPIAAIQEDPRGGYEAVGELKDVDALPARLLMDMRFGIPRVALTDKSMNPPISALGYATALS